MRNVISGFTGLVVVGFIALQWKGVGPQEDNLGLASQLDLEVATASHALGSAGGPEAAAALRRAQAGVEEPVGADEAPAGDGPAEEPAADAALRGAQAGVEEPVGADEAPAGDGPAEELAAPAEEPARGDIPGRNGTWRAKYGFYVHAFKNLPAVKYQVLQVQKFFPGSPIYIMSDGGYRFDGLCEKYGCTFVLCPPANDRWHLWPFLRRMYDAAVSLQTEYVILLEPDNTIHGPIAYPPTADAGGLDMKTRTLNGKAYAEKMAREVNPASNFEFDKAMQKTGLAGGSYYRTAAILDTFHDDNVARIDWNYLEEAIGKKVFSSDFAMPYVLASKGYKAEPWLAAAQMEQDKDVPWSGAQDATFRHYSRGYPGGKPTYNMKLEQGDELLYRDSEHRTDEVNCQLCYSLEEYKRRWGSDRCTNKNHWEYSEKIKKRKEWEREQDRLKKR